MPVTLAAGHCVNRKILPARRRPLGPQELSKRLGPAVAEWITGAAYWADMALGESRCLIFETPLTAGVTFFVRFWSVPHAPLLCEIPSGRQDEAIRKHLKPEAASWAERRGLTVLGEAENYRRSFPLDSAADRANVVAFVVDAFVSMIGYQALTPLFATSAHDSRVGWDETLDSFAEEEVARVFRAEGFTVEWARTEDGDLVDPPVFRCLKAGTESFVQLMDPVPGQRLYQRVRFNADLPMADDEAEEARRAGVIPPGGRPTVAITGIHAFTGGVTKAWLVERVREWDAALAEQRSAVQRGRKPGPASVPPSETIH